MADSEKNSSPSAAIARAGTIIWRARNRKFRKLGALASSLQRTENLGAEATPAWNRKKFPGRIPSQNIPGFNAGASNRENLHHGATDWWRFLAWQRLHPMSGTSRSFFDGFVLSPMGWSVPSTSMRSLTTCSTHRCVLIGLTSLHTILKNSVSMPPTSLNRINRFVMEY